MRARPRRRRRGKRNVEEVVETEAVAVATESEVAELKEAVKEPLEDAAAPAASTRKPDEPVPVYKFGSPSADDEMEVGDEEGATLVAVMESATPVAAVDGREVVPRDDHGGFNAVLLSLQAGALVVARGLHDVPAISAGSVHRRSLLRRDADAHRVPLGAWPPPLPRPPTPPRR